MPPQVNVFYEFITEFITGKNSDGTLKLKNYVVFNQLHNFVLDSECFDLYMAHEQMIDNKPVIHGRDRLLAYCFNKIVKKEGVGLHRRAADMLYLQVPLTGNELLGMRLYCERKMVSSMLNVPPRMRKGFLKRWLVVMVMKNMRPDKSIYDAVEQLPKNFLAKLRQAGYLRADEGDADNIETLQRLFIRADNEFYKGKAQAYHAASKVKHL